MTTQQPLTGSCLCGAVQVRIAASPLLTLACHCRDCQKLSAGAFSLTTMFPRDAFSCAGDLVEGGRGTAGRAYYLCRSCLNFVFTRIDAAGSRVNLRTSVLDDAADFAPFVEVMAGEKLPWVHVPAVHSYTRYPETPEELQALMADYSRWRSG